MAVRERQSNSVQAVLKVSQKEKIRNLPFSFIDDLTDMAEPELTRDDVIDSPGEADDLSEYEDEYDYDSDLEAESEKFISSYCVIKIKPLWILHEGQLIWASSRHGFKLAEKEYFRRRLQTLLDFLADEFPGKTSGDLLLSLQGFFVRDNDEGSDPTYWLETLRNSGIIYGEDKMLPIKSLRAGKGQGKDSASKSVRLPDNLEYLWLERELSKPEHYSEEPFSWKNCNSWLPSGIRDFCSKVNELCAGFETDTEDKRVHGLGLKLIKFGYQDSTLQRKRLKGWALWWNRKNSEYF
ncbi:MAG: hypothetical protein II917_08675 [Synergistaceae bacterium]|nr:hypothetical protein [Synergistaceae bacterium]